MGYSSAAFDFLPKLARAPGRLWAFTFGKLMTDGVWWFFLFWLPKYNMGTGDLVIPLTVLYSTVSGSIGGCRPGSSSAATAPGRPTGAACTCPIRIRRQLIWRFDYDTEAGVPHNRQLFVDMTAQRGWPDGAAINRDGCYWMCGNNGGYLLRFTPAGVLEIELPMAKPSMCSFDGAGSMLRRRPAGRARRG